MRLLFTIYDLRFTSYELRVTNYELRTTNYELRTTNYELRTTIWMLARYARDMRSECAAEFWGQGKLLARKRPESRHAEPAALLNRQWFVILMTCFLHPEETHGKWVE